MPLEIRELIREMSIANPLWGALRIHGELVKLGIEIGQTSCITNIFGFDLRQAQPSSSDVRCSRDQVVMRRMEGDDDRDGAVGAIPVAGEMEGVRRLIDRVMLPAFRERPEP